MTVSIWTVYHRPRDMPGVEYVARRWVVTHVARPTDDTLVEDRLDNLRDILEARGLTPIRRSDQDDPTIVETWL